ncbi:unnamed protein product [Aphis gossypii]|uniref:Uncharacterized protein n=1 Tax=Aphis gossypii TaxID=80765 RepID=A0A9P0J3G2_APHGO|nr:unnamed protein product [Aphis gossypii]
MRAAKVYVASRGLATPAMYNSGLLISYGCRCHIITPLDCTVYEVYNIILNINKVKLVNKLKYVYLSNEQCHNYLLNYKVCTAHVPLYILNCIHL